MDYKICFSVLLFLCSCEFYGKSSNILFDDLPEEIRLEKSLEDEDQSAIKVRCRQEGETCSEYKSCKAFCDDLYFNFQGRENCYNWSYSFFESFERLAYYLETLAFSKLDFPTMKCFFEMSENHRINIFKNFTEKSAEAFLEEIAINEELALLLFKSDKGSFNILKDLFDKIDRRPYRAIRRELFSGENFLVFAQKYSNSTANKWADDFIRYECKKTSTCQNPLEYYCKILAETSRKDLEKFLASHWFERAYKADIESETCYSSNCKYEKVSHFKKFCEKF